MTEKCFVAMPFEPPFDDYYRRILKPAIADAGYLPVRADEIYGTRPVIEDIFREMREAAAVVADVSGKNPNVNYEVGVAHALQRPTVIIAQSADDIPFNYQDRRAVVYDTRKVDWAAELRRKVTESLRHAEVEPVTLKETCLQIVNKKSEKCLDVAFGHTHNGNKIHQWSYNGDPTQQWLLRSVDGRYFYILSRHSEKCLDVADKRSDEGAPVQQWDYVGNENQKWTLDQNEDGTYQIRAKHSRRCLAVASDDDGAPVIQSRYQGHDYQRWWLNLIL